MLLEIGMVSRTTKNFMSTRPSCRRASSSRSTWWVVMIGMWPSFAAKTSMTFSRLEGVTPFPGLLSLPLLLPSSCRRILDSRFWIRPDQCLQGEQYTVGEDPPKSTSRLLSLKLLKLIIKISSPVRPTMARLKLDLPVPGTMEQIAPSMWDASATKPFWGSWVKMVFDIFDGISFVFVRNRWWRPDWFWCGKSSSWIRHFHWHPSG